MLLVGDRTLGQTSMAEAKGFRLGRYRFAIARATGESHQKKREVCDDYWVIASEGAATAMVIADGAGSAPLGQEGAQLIACALAECTVQEAVAGRMASGQADTNELRDSIIAETDRLRLRLASKHPFRDAASALKLYASTFTGFLAVGDTVVSFKIGDGFGACIGDRWPQASADEAFATCICPPENGAYANETFFFTQVDWADRLRVGFIPKERTIVAMTDGLTTFACSKGYVDLERAFWAPVLKYFGEKSEEETAQALVSQLCSRAVTDVCDDDKTLVIMQRID